jgi:hypothetical protein
VTEVLGRYFIRSYDEVADEMFKGYGLPPYEAVEVARRAENEFANPDNHVNFLARQILPSLNRAGILVARTDRSLDMMRIVEGVRACAAEKGKLPQNLAEVPLPMPLDVMTGKPFEYVHEDQEVQIVSPSPEKDPRGGQVIVLKLKK